MEKVEPLGPLSELPHHLWNVTAFLFTARGHEKSASLHTFKCLKRKSQMNSCMGTCVALSIFCLNIGLLCSPLNAFETWADQQELSKEARCKSAFSTRRRVSLLECGRVYKHTLLRPSHRSNVVYWQTLCSAPHTALTSFTDRRFAPPLTPL